MVCSIMSVLAALKAYQEVLVLTQGGPLNATFTGLYYAYDQGLKHLKLPLRAGGGKLRGVHGCCVAIMLLCFRYIKAWAQAVFGHAAQLHFPLRPLPGAVRHRAHLHLPVLVDFRHGHLDRGQYLCLPADLLAQIAFTGQFH